MKLYRSLLLNLIFNTITEKNIKQLLVKTRIMKNNVVLNLFHQ